MFVLLSPFPRSFLPPGIRSFGLRTQGGRPSLRSAVILSSGHCSCCFTPFRKSLSDAETYECGDLGARSTRLGQEAGTASLIFSALVDPCSVGLDSSYSVTQVGHCFDLPTHKCTRHPQSHAHPHMFPRHGQVDLTGGMSSLSHVLSWPPRAYVGPG